MKYTVIVPVYNGEDTIGRCLGSLLNQKGMVFNEDYAILVVDDGSTDNTSNILTNYPIQVVRLPENQGRIVARLTGAKHAKTDRVLFVDSRVTLSEDTLVKLNDLEDYPAVIGETDPTETKYQSVLHTILYLIRRRYYGKAYFPIQADEMVIDRENFRRAPKGTAVLLIDRDLFVDLTPERTGRDVNDDTLLFHNLVFRHDLSLLRSRKLFFRYSQRTDLKQFTGWLFHRGVRFSDFYLRPGGYFFTPFLLLSFVAMVFLAGAFILPASIPSTLLFILSLILFLNAAIAVYLAESPKDISRAFVALPLIILIFGSGILKFWAGLLSSSFGLSDRIGISK